MSSGEDTPPKKRLRSLKKPQAIYVRDKKSDEELDGLHYACNICDQVFLHRANYMRHSQRHEAPGGFICSLCQHPFTTDWDRNKHKREEHSVFRCRICKAEFPVERDYNKHIQTDHAGRDREYDVCPNCGQQFRSGSQLKVHVESNCGTEKRHKCDVCHSKYLTQASLNAHMIKHLGEKSHLCNYCGASFLNKGQLKVHERMHTGEKPYKCNQCDKAFAHRESLITHSTTHTGIKPYHCSYCDSRFSCIGNLLKHRRARPDTCGQPQYCRTNKIAARPNIKTMPNLTDRQIYTQKVIQRSGPPRKKNRQSYNGDEIDFTPVSTKKKSTQIKEEVDHDYEPIVQAKTKTTVKQSPNMTEKTKLVTLKVEHSTVSADENVDIKADDWADEEHKVADIDDTMDVKIEGVQIYSDDENIEIVQEEIVSNSQEADFTFEKNSMSDCETNIEYEVEIEPADTDPNYEQKAVLIPVFGSEGLTTKLLQKPPVITDKKRRGRPRVIIPPKVDTEHMILVDVDSKKREIEMQREVFELNMEQLTVGCYGCCHCPQQYSSSYLVGRHLEREHGFVLKELLETLQYGKQFARDKRFQCRFCGRLYANEKALEKHVVLHGEDGKLIHKCVCCSNHYETEEEAKEHALIEHRDRLECTLCAKVFKEPEILNNHIKYYHEKQRYKYNKTYVCPKCGKNFISRTAVSDHERSNCGKDPFYRCEICNKNFTSASTLKTHVTLHTNEFPFPCQYCDKSYRTNGQVKLHERVHTGEKPFACEYCPKTFSRRESYHTHRSLHTGIKRFMCSGCGMRFTCVSALKSHRRSHISTCGSIPNVSKVMGPPGSGYHDVPEGFCFPFQKAELEEYE